MRALTSRATSDYVERPMNSILSEALQMSSVMIGRSDVQTQIEFDAARPMINVSAAQLLQVMLNLLHNAVDSMRDVTDRPRALRLRTQTAAGFVIAEIGDSGVGLPGGDADRVFDPLFTTKTGGMGLGLSICRRIVMAHGGTIFARANSGPGATFVVRLPQVGREGGG
jgi:two-component system sensor kinase FixL